LQKAVVGEERETSLSFSLLLHFFDKKKQKLVGFEGA